MSNNLTKNLSIMLVLVMFFGFIFFSTNVEGQPPTLGLKVVFNDSYSEISPTFQDIPNLSVVDMVTGTTVAKLELYVLMRTRNAVQGTLVANLDVYLNNELKASLPISQEISLTANQYIQIYVSTLTAATLESYAEDNQLANYDLEIKVTDGVISGNNLNSQSMIIPLSIDTSVVVNDEPTSPPPNPPPPPETPTGDYFGFETGLFGIWSSSTTSGSVAEVVTTDPYEGYYHAHFATDNIGDNYALIYSTFAGKDYLKTSAMFKFNSLTSIGGLPHKIFVHAYGAFFGNAISRVDIYKTGETWYFTLVGINGDVVEEAQTSTVVPLGSWVKLSLETYINGTSGYHKLYVNDGLIASLSGKDTDNRGQIVNSFIGLMHIYNGAVNDIYVDKIGEY